jgi:hypothetical protein
MIIILAARHLTLTSDVSIMVPILPIKDVEDFERLGFKDKLNYLYKSVIATYSSGAAFPRLEPRMMSDIIDGGCRYHLDSMERRMDEKAKDFLYDWKLLPKEDFIGRFGYDGGVCTKDLEIYLSDRPLHDPYITGGAMLFHERMHRRMKEEIGQLVPVLDETLAHRALWISMGAYDRLKPSDLYRNVHDSVGDYFDKSMQRIKAGDKFKQVIELISSSDEKTNKLQLIPDFILQRN